MTEGPLNIEVTQAARTNISRLVEAALRPGWNLSETGVVHTRPGDGFMAGVRLNGTTGVTTIHTDMTYPDLGKLILPGGQSFYQFVGQHRHEGSPAIYSGVVGTRIAIAFLPFVGGTPLEFDIHCASSHGLKHVITTAGAHIKTQHYLTPNEIGAVDQTTGALVRRLFKAKLINTMSAEEIAANNLTLHSGDITLLGVPVKERAPVLPPFQTHELPWGLNMRGLSLGMSQTHVTDDGRAAGAYGTASGYVYNNENSTFMIGFRVIGIGINPDGSLPNQTQDQIAGLLQSTG